jgi:hypothetical protein
MSKEKKHHHPPTTSTASGQTRTRPSRPGRLLAAEKEHASVEAAWKRSRRYGDESDRTTLVEVVQSWDRFRRLIEAIGFDPEIDAHALLIIEAAYRGQAFSIPIEIADALAEALQQDLHTTVLAALRTINAGQRK